MQREIENLKNKDKKEVSIKKSRRKNKQVKKQKQEIFLVYKGYKSKINDLAREIKKKDFDLDFLLLIQTIHSFLHIDHLFLHYGL
jgi:SOS response regulatory protein OraA/RecX